MKRRLRIIQDSDAFNPRTEYDCHVGRMLCWHRRYNLGDDHDYDSDDWKEELACEADPDLADKLDHIREEVWNAIVQCLQDDGGYSFEDAMCRADSAVSDACEAFIDRAFDVGYVALPLYLYDHSGITMSTGRFSCPWDSGCVGVIVCDRKTVDEEFGGDEDRAEAALRAEVEEYDHYLTGNVWGFVAEESCDDDCNDCSRCEDWNEVDSCWGFLGNPEDIKPDLGPDWEDCEVEIEYC